MGLKESLDDYLILMVNKYIQGEWIHKSRTVRRECEDVSYSMIHLINDACGIHSDGIELGEIYPARYKREKKRRKRYWKRVNDGKSTDTRRGFAKYRRTERE